MRAWLSAILVLAPLSQAAAIVIVTHGEAADCYLATLAQAPKYSDGRGIAICNRAIEDAGDNADLRAKLLVNRADIRLETQDYPGAVADATSSIAIEPQLAAAYVNLGAGLVGLQRFREAIPVLEKAIALGVTERSHLAYYNSGIAKENLGDIKGAYFDYKRALEISPDFAPAKEQLLHFRVITKPN